MSSFDKRLEEELAKLEEEKKKKKKISDVTGGIMRDLTDSRFYMPTSQQGLAEMPMFTAPRQDIAANLTMFTAPLYNTQTNASEKISSYLNNDDDIAPTKTDLLKSFLDERNSGKHLFRSSVQDEAEKTGLDFFQRSKAFDDGYNFGDVTKTILGTVADLNVNAVKGVVGLAEGVVDLAGYGVAGVADLLGKDEFANALKKSLYENTVDTASKPVDDYLDKYSVLGRTSDSIGQGIGQVGAMIATGGLASAAGLGAAGTTAVTSGLMGFSSMGSGMGEAYQGGATDGEAVTYGLIAGASDAISELIFGGLGKSVNALGLSTGLSSADDILAKKVSKMFSSQMAKNFAEYGIKAGAEGFEEVLAGVAQAAGKWKTYMSEDEDGNPIDFWDVLKDENLLEQFVVGAVTSGIAQANGLHIANKTDTDFVTGYNQNEQSVIDKVVKDRITEAEQDGKKVTGREKTKIYDSVVNDMEKGYISTDTIEEVLGGDNYKAYQDTIKSEDDALAELAELYEGDELKAETEKFLTNSKRSEAAKNLSDSVFDLVKSSRLGESYREKARRGQKFEADLSKYDEKQRATVQKAVESGILNNTNRTHEMVDIVAKISADKGVLFDFTNNDKLKDTIYAVDGKTVNGFVTKDGITINVDSKKYINTVVGHEITHVLEGTDLYDTLQETLFEYAKKRNVTKDSNEYKERLRSLYNLYKDVDGYKGVEGFNAIKRELTADLVGDYLFTDSQFINNLSTNHRNVFQKIYDEVKYLVKVATAGSKEARELENVKKAFDEAYRATGNAQANTKYSLAMVEKIEPKSDKWSRTHTTEEAMAKFPNMWNVTADESEVRNPTQITSTVNSYRKIYNFLQDEGFNGSILDASSGLGYGTKAGIDEYGFNVEDIEPYPDKGYKPKYTDYSTLDKKYDVIISNAVLNVLPQDQRDALAIKMGELLNDGGRLFVNVRGKDVESLAKTGKNIHLGNMEWIETVKGSYQKGFTKPELVAYLQDALGDGFTVKPTNMFGAVSAVVTKDGGVKYSLSTDSNGRQLSNEQKEYFKDSKVVDENGNLMTLFHGTQNDFTVFDISRSGENYEGGWSELGEGIYLTPDKKMAEYYGDNAGWGREVKLMEVYADIKNPFNTQDAVEFDISDLVQKYELTETDERFMKKAGYRLVDFLKHHNLSVRDYLTSKGFDGIWEKDLSGYVHQVVAYAENQIKNVDNAKPTSDPDIRYSLSTDSDGKNLTKEQAEYFKKSKMRDADGNLKVMYHGTPNGDFAIFKDGTYFTDNKEYADRYQNPGASSISTGKIASNPKTFEVYLNIKKPFDIKDAEARRIYIEEYIRGGNAMGINPYLSDAEYAKINSIDWTEGEDLREFLIENEYDYDGLVLDEGGTGGYGDDVQSRGTSYVVFSPEQVKDADNKNPTDNPDIYRSMSDTGEQPRRYGNYNVSGQDIALETAPVQEEVAPVQEEVQTQTAEELFPDNLQPVQQELENLIAEQEDIRGAMEAAAAVGDYATVNQLLPEYDEVTLKVQELQAQESERTNTLTEADMPPVAEAPYPGEASNETVDNPFEDRDWYKVGNQKVKAYMYENPEVKPFFQDEALALLSEFKDTTRGERFYNDQAYLTGGNEEAWTGVSRHTSKSMETLLDSWDMSYADIEKGLNAIIEDNGAENIAAAKKIEFMLNDRLLNGYTDFYSNSQVPPNQDYINLLAEKQINEYSEEAFSRFMETADQYAPPETDIAPLPTQPVVATETELGGKEVSGQQTYITTESKLRNSKQQTGTEQDIPTYDVTAKKGVPEGQQAFMPDAGVPKKITRSELHSNIVNKIKSTFSENGFDFDTVLKKAKDLSTFATVDNTPQRVNEKALGYKEGQILNDLTVNQVAVNETNGIKWLNYFTHSKYGLLRKISKEYNIKPGSKESAAAQMYAEGFYVNDNDEIISYGDKELAADFPDAKVRNNIKNLAGDSRIRKIYDDTLAKINASRTRNAYPEIPRLDNYFLHFRAMEDTFSRLGLPFNPNDIRAKDLPTDLNGVTADLKPGQPYFSSAMHRTGKRTSFDLLGGLEKYLTSAKNQIYHIDDIQTLRALRNYIADSYGQAKGLENLNTLSEEEVQEHIQQVYGSHLSTYAKFLNEEANVLAGKTSLIDRGLEGIIGRRGMTFLDTVNRQVGSNMVGFNVSSSLTNFISVAQALAKTNKASFLKAFTQTVSSRVRSMFGETDSFVANNPTIVRRKGADRFYRTPWQKASDAGYAMMGAVDSISTELIVRAKYNEFVKKGMDSKKAVWEADKWASRLMGDRSLGQQPQLYNSKMLGMITKFQLEVRNQLDSQFYDTIQEAKVSNEDIKNGLARNAKTAAKVGSTFFQLAVAQHLFGKAFESVAGYNPAFDIIGVLIKAFGFDDDEESEDTALDNIEQGFLELLGDLPYTSALTGGRIPISSALPVEQFITGKDQYGNEKDRLETITEVAPYYLMPGGYGQLKKTVQGLGMFDEVHPVAGSYTDSGNLRFPVEDTLANRVQAGLFGQWASSNARDYFDNDRSPLKEKQIQEFIDVDIPIKDYWNYREGLSKFSTLSEKAAYINSLDLPIEKKNILINNIADREEDIDLTGFDNYSSFEEFDFAVKNPEKYEIAQAVGGYEDYMTYQEGMKDMKLEEKVQYVAGLDLTVEQKNALINGETDRKEPIDLTGYENYSSFEEFEYAKANPEKYAVAKAVGGYDAYKSYSSDLYDIKADKDSDGKSISGSRKEKVFEYIDNLDAEYGEKIILFKSEYPSDDTYNYEIIDYLNSREDISYDEMVTILKKLNFTVLADGTVQWD